MDAVALRLLLISDWAQVENTPPRARRPAALHRWMTGADHLARQEGCSLLPLVSELRSEALCVAQRQREELTLDLARDLAVHRAQGRQPGPPWLRRLERLVDLLQLPPETVRTRIEEIADRIEVAVLTKS